MSPNYGQLKHRKNQSKHAPSSSAKPDSNRFQDDLPNGIQNGEKDMIKDYVGLLLPDGPAAVLRLGRPDPLIGSLLPIPNSGINGAPFGFIVRARLVDPYPPYRGYVIETLGPADDPDVQVRAILSAAMLPISFSEGALKEAQDLPQDPSPDDIDRALQAGRIDLRHLPTLTIDGEDAKDLDDAIDLIEHPDGSADLYVHIADVTAFVPYGSMLDQEAALRGNSVYIPGQVIPMYPSRLSNGLCSLNPGKPRFTMTAQLHLNAEGECLHADFYESLIESKHRGNYHEVQAILDGHLEPSTSTTNIPNSHDDQSLTPSLIQTIRTMGQWAERLERKREIRGALRFHSSEIELDLDAEQEVQEIRPSEEGSAHALIESFMLAANEAVARYLCQHKAVAIYRVHEDPDPERLFSFIQMARQMGVQSRIPSRPSPKELALLIQELERHPRGRILSDSLLRAMAKARYDRNNLGHFALSSTYYCHFTSPIRRYADDCIHRALKAALKHEPNPLPGATAEKLSAWISETERRAIAAERAVTDLKVARYYQKHLGEIKHGMIVGLTSNMAFVRLEDGAEGAMLFRDLPAYYRLNESGIQAYPDSHGPILSLGDQVRVQIARVDLERRSIDLHLLEQESALPALHMRNSRGTRGFRSRRGKKPGRGSQAGKRTVRGSHRGRGSQSSHEGKTAQGSQTGKLRSNRRTKVGQRIGKGAQATRKTRISKKGQRKQR